MKYLCLAYGSGEDWKKLTRTEQNALLAQDDVMRRRGDLVAAVNPSVATVRAWNGTPTTTYGPFADAKAPLAGFGIIEAADLNEAIRLVTDTPCARANGAIELRVIEQMNDVHIKL